jgi:hypothetical protein
MFFTGGRYAMISMKSWIIIIIIPIVLNFVFIHASEVSGTEKVLSAAVFVPMPAPGKKVPIGDGYYLLYGFDKRPKLGMITIKVQIFSEKGKKDSSFEVKADAGMPSMSGAHETGEQAFVLSKKGDYLHPINIVMPGDWEIRMTILKQGKVIFRGRYNFDV